MRDGELGLHENLLGLRLGLRLRVPEWVERLVLVEVRGVVLRLRLEGLRLRELGLGKVRLGLGELGLRELRLGVLRLRVLQLGLGVDHLRVFEKGGLRETDAWLRDGRARVGRGHDHHPARCLQVGGKALGMRRVGVLRNPLLDCARRTWFGLGVGFLSICAALFGSRFRRFGVGEEVADHEVLFESGDACLGEGFRLELDLKLALL